MSSTQNKSQIIYSYEFHIYVYRVLCHEIQKIQESHLKNKKQKIQIKNTMFSIYADPVSKVSLLNHVLKKQFIKNNSMLSTRLKI
jgi:hypothetical protein